MRAQRGYTLLEVIIAVSILALAGAGLTGSVSLALRVSERLERQAVAKTLAVTEVEQRYVQDSRESSLLPGAALDDVILDCPAEAQTCVGDYWVVCDDGAWRCVVRSRTNREVIFPLGFGAEAPARHPDEEDR